jgi:hypothetical protein
MSKEESNNFSGKRAHPIYYIVIDENIENSVNILKKNFKSEYLTINKNSDWNKYRNSKNEITPILIIEEFVRKSWDWNFYTIYDHFFHKKIIFLITKYEIDKWYEIFKNKNSYTKEVFDRKLWRLDESYVYNINNENREVILRDIFISYKNNIELQNCKIKNIHYECKDN